MARRPVGPTAGRGQAAPTAPVAPAQTMLTNALLVPLVQLAPDPGQPRRHFDETGLAELAGSIAEEGVLQPILVYEDGALDDGRIRYTILDGERRYRASLRVRTDVPVIVVTGRDVADIRIRQLVANLQREELDPLEEALALRQLMQLSGLGIKNIARRIGKPAAYVQRRNDLLYDPRLTEAVHNGQINASVAVELKHLPDEQRQVYLDRVAVGERLEVAQLREAKRAEKRRARAVLFGGADAGEQAHGGTLPVPPVDQSGYRIDTPASPTTIDHDPDATKPSATGYRIDTPLPAVSGHDEPAATGPQGAITPGSAWEPQQHDDAQEGPVAGDGAPWAAALAEALLQAGEATPHGGVAEAVRTWRAAGRPSSWGEVLLHVLDARVSPDGPGA